MLTGLTMVSCGSSPPFQILTIGILSLFFLAIMDSAFSVPIYNTSDLY